MCRDKDEVSIIPDLYRDELRSGIYDIPGMRWEEENIENIPDICGDQKQFSNVGYLRGRGANKKHT